MKPAINGHSTAGNADPDRDPDSEQEQDELPPPPGFPHKNDFEAFSCYKCVEAHP